MTNAEKFKEIFGCEPDLDVAPFKCNFKVCNQECNYWVDNYGQCERWWFEEYKKIETAIPDLISKDTPSIVNLFSCPYILPCGWCDKRDMLCNQFKGE